MKYSISVSPELLDGRPLSLDEELCVDYEELCGLYIDSPDVCAIEPSRNRNFQKFEVKDYNGPAGLLRFNHVTGVTVERGYRENSGSDVTVQRGDENDK